MTTRSDNNYTRRRVFQAGLAAVGGVAAVRGAFAADKAASPAMKLAQEKIAPALVQYQTTPKDGAKCSTCVNFEAPNACKIVSGTILPDGWCIAYAPKES